MEMCRYEFRIYSHSLPKRGVVSAPRANIFVLNKDIPVSQVPLIPTPVAPPLPPPHEPRLHGLSLRPVDLLGLLPLHRDDPIHPDDVPPVDMPAPSICPCPADHLLLPIPPLAPAPSLPAETTYGLVHTKLALACARELPNSVVTLEQVFDLVWGPYRNNDEKNLLVALPPDRLIFLCTLAAIAALEPVFEGFLQPVIMEFARA
ncbi:hypothetical protein B0H13DRAFT_2386187 [Mycena leptocephala]|nr:hypothetical protein B0H13DRAFT_2386187 [Mycena leptocephala]